ncbi:hypothetical protein EVAR_91918_1, partial [Eumeta japonica]
IPQSNEGKPGSFMDRCHSRLLERLTAEFLHIFDKCPQAEEENESGICPMPSGVYSH